MAVPMMQHAVSTPFSGTAVELQEGRRPTHFARSHEDRERLERYHRAARLLDVSQHRDLFITAAPGSRPPSECYWIPLDFPGMLARLLRDYTVGDGFRLEAIRQNAQRSLEQLLDSSDMAVKMRRASELLPAFGDAVFRIAVEDREEDMTGELEPRAVVKFVPPWHYFPELDPLDMERVMAVTLAWVFEKPKDLSGPSDFLVLREIHEPGRYEYRVNDWDGTRLGEDRTDEVLERMFPDLEPEVETGISEIPVVHVGNNPMAGHHFGRSEFERIWRLVLALENRLAQEDEVLEKHARPKLIVGPGVLDEEGKANLADFDVIEVEPSVMEKAVKPEYLTWDMQIQAIQHQIEKLEEYLFITTETSPASFGLERDGSQVESARALRFKSHRTVNKVQTLRDEWAKAVKSMVRIATAMENVAREEDERGTLTPTAVRIVWPDPIVEDQTQEVQDYVALKSASLVSRKRAVRDLFNLSDEEAEREVRDILQDEVDEAATQRVAAPGPPPEGEDDLLGAEAGSSPAPPESAPPEGVTPANEA